MYVVLCFEVLLLVGSMGSCFVCLNVSCISVNGFSCVVVLGWFLGLCFNHFLKPCFGVAPCCCVNVVNLLVLTVG